MSPLIEYLIIAFGWRGAMGIISGILLMGCLFGALFKPVPSVGLEEELDKEKAIIDIEPKLANEIEVRTEDCDGEVVSDDGQVERETDEDIHFPKQTSLALSRLSLPHENNNNTNGMVPGSPNNSLAKSVCSVQVYLNDQPMEETETKPRSHSFSPGLLYRKDIFYSGSLMNISNYSEESDYQAKPKTKADCFLLRWLNCSDEIIDTFFEMIDLSLMRNFVFLIFLISNFMTSIGYHIPYIYLKVCEFLVQRIRLTPSSPPGSNRGVASGLGQ